MQPDSITALIIEYRYWILIPLSLLEGPIVAFVGGTLSWLGYLNPFVAFSIFFLRDILFDCFFYFIGRFGRHTRLAQWTIHKVGMTGGHLDNVRHLWHNHGFRTMFFSKLSYGLSAAFLTVAGLIDFDVRRFLRYAVIIALTQYGTLFLLGYFIGTAIGVTENALEVIQRVILIGGLFALAYIVFSYYMRRRTLEQEKHPD